VTDAIATSIAVGGVEALAFVEGIEGYEACLIQHDATWSMTPGFALVSDVNL
jgi:hypothetical protein